MALDTIPLKPSLESELFFNPPMFEQTFKNIDEVRWKDAGCTSELDDTEQTSWMLFPKYLAALEHDKATQAALDGKRAEIMEKIAALDAESAEVLGNIKGEL